jgi:hypothetical protein
LGWFRAISLPHVTHSENGCRGAYKARVFATGTISSFFCNEHAQSTTLGPKLKFGWFRAIPLPHVTHSENGCRVHTKHDLLSPDPFLHFSQRTCPIHYFGSKTHVWGWFRAISLPHVTHSENGCRVHKKHESSPPEPFLRFSQRTCPIHYFRSKTHVWGGFAQFRCRTSPIPKMGVGVHTKHEFLPPEPIRRFFATNMPNPLL